MLCEFADTPVLDFLASRRVRNKCSLLNHCGYMALLLQQPEQTKTNALNTNLARAKHGKSFLLTLSVSQVE